MSHTKLMNHDTSYSIIFVDVDIAYREFEAAGAEGNGYDWEVVLTKYLAKENPALLPQFKFDSEGSMFCAYGSDESALEEVGKSLELLIEDRRLLQEVIASVGPEEWD